MRLIERRIGLLFGAFLLCFLVIVVRAFWLQGVQGSQLASEAAYQQTEVVEVPGLRGDLLDRRGNKLAASEDAATVYATPYQVKNPPQAAAQLRRFSMRRRAKSWKRLPPKAASPTSPRKSISAPPPRWKRSTWKGSASCPTAAAPTPRGRWRDR